MFERYTEPARRVLFFGRYESSATGSVTIESEHLLLGLLREAGPIARRLLAETQVSTEQLRKEIEERIVFREKVATSVEIPFSEHAKRILTYTAEEADRLGHSEIGPEHMLLALLRLPESTAGAILTGHGLRLQTAREAVVAMRAEGAPSRPRGAEGILPDIDRIQHLVEQIRKTHPKTQESSELFHLLDVELASLRGRFS